MEIRTPHEIAACKGQDERASPDPSGLLAEFLAEPS